MRLTGYSSKPQELDTENEPQRMTVLLRECSRRESEGQVLQDAPTAVIALHSVLEPSQLLPRTGSPYGVAAARCRRTDQHHASPKKLALNQVSGRRCMLPASRPTPPRRSVSHKVLTSAFAFTPRVYHSVVAWLVAAAMQLCTS
jgi:hypothetical protein